MTDWLWVADLFDRCARRHQDISNELRGHEAPAMAFLALQEDVRGRRFERLAKWSRQLAKNPNRPMPLSQWQALVNGREEARALEADAIQEWFERDAVKADQQ